MIQFLYLQHTDDTYCGRTHPALGEKRVGEIEGIGDGQISGRTF